MVTSRWIVHREVFDEVPPRVERYARTSSSRPKARRNRSA
jgi:hypothetical protein